MIESLRERKKVQLRERFIAEAQHLFRERGYDATTVDDIAAAAGVSRRTFFRYFDTKEDVLFAEHGPRLAAFRELLAAEAEAGQAPLAAVRAAIVRLFAASVAEQRRAPDDFGLHRRIVRQVPALAARVRSFDLDWEAAIAAHLGGAHAEPEAALLAGMIVGAARVAIRRWEAGHYRQSPLPLVERALQLIQSN
jgi:AcrR family transcriptional regulator